MKLADDLDYPMVDVSCLAPHLEFQRHGRLGGGSSAIVYKATWKKTEGRVAVKLMHLPALRKDKPEILPLIEEEQERHEMAYGKEGEFHHPYILPIVFGMQTPLFRCEATVPFIRISHN